MLTGRAMLAGVAGWPVAHSRSPLLHGSWIARHGLDAAYVPLAIEPANFALAIRGLAAAGFRGLNVTIPHKEAAFAVCDEVLPRAHRAGAVNTLIFREGRIIGDCTDGFGFLASLPDYDARRGPAVLLGAGGAARAIAAALLDAGCPHLTLVNRTPERAEALALALGGNIHVSATPPLEGTALLVNTTSLGMAGQPPLTLELAALPDHALVADIVYAPLETPLLAAARARGLIGVDGLGMLLHQARPGFEAWFGVAPVVDDELRRIVAADIPPR
ncbi:shikimate dehydrogenase [Sediminicoccus sp. KRV36]|uniref:shikimate dehydrogenase n=1 Tax=Sediminicoccus sp. KRV36 TaxID=3133721 RepID=UPI00200E3DEE|nr:shikimate dehydrogenase [Sediminicoccus rosea]UPY36168.1 shikimate dehydrogenase [Sediminicoccus rosea]